jgi:hypothetical protein
MREGLCEAIGHDVPSRVWNEQIHMVEKAIGGISLFLLWQECRPRHCQECEHVLELCE